MKKALIVGINYVGTPNELRGCVNDAHIMNSLLQEHFNFAATDIKMLLDASATTAKMLAELNNLVANTAPGDTIFFHYSGHGSQMVDKNADEADGLDEIICPVDLNWRDKVIKDDDLKAIFDTVPKGVNLTIILDCCNSGGALDQANQFQAITDKVVQDDELVGGRFLPPPEFAIEGAEELALNFKPKLIQSRDVNNVGLLLTGCRSNQTSADAYINGIYQGAFTYSLKKVLADNSYNINYVDLITKSNQFMVDVGFTQRPELNGSPSLFGAKFLEEQEAVSSGLEPLLDSISVQPVIENDPVPAAAPVEPEKDNKKIITIIAIVVALSAAAFFIFV